MTLKHAVDLRPGDRINWRDTPGLPATVLRVTGVPLTTDVIVEWVPSDASFTKQVHASRLVEVAS